MRFPLPLAAALLLLAEGAALAASGPLLQPGTLTGSLSPYVVKRGESLGGIAAKFAVHPVRVRKPNMGLLRDGLQFGERIRIDKRRVTPEFSAGLDGVVLNVPEAHVYLVRQGRLVRDYPVGVSRSDWKVPIGQTRIVSRQRHPIWHVPESIQEEMREKGLPVKTEVPAGPENPLGTRWLGFWNGSYGLHGTTAPASIKRYASHGCVRFRRADIEDLYERVRVGTPVHVLYQPALLAADAQGVWLSVYPDPYERNYDYPGAIKSLVARAHAGARVDWARIERAIRLKDGVIVNVARDGADPLVRSLSPQPKASPKPSPRPTPSPTPSPAPSSEALFPSEEPTIMPLEPGP